MRWTDSLSASLSVGSSTDTLNDAKTGVWSDESTRGSERYSDRVQSESFHERTSTRSHHAGMRCALYLSFTARRACSSRSSATYMLG